MDRLIFNSAEEVQDFLEGFSFEDVGFVEIEDNGEEIIYEHPEGWTIRYVPEIYRAELKYPPENEADIGRTLGFFQLNNHCQLLFFLFRGLNIIKLSDIVQEYKYEIDCTFNNFDVGYFE